MSTTLTQFETDLAEFKSRYPMVVLKAITPDDFVQLDSALPHDWDAPVMRSIRDVVDINYDLENGTGFEEVASMIPDAVLAAEELMAEPAPSLPRRLVANVVRIGYRCADIEVEVDDIKDAYATIRDAACNQEFRSEFDADYEIHGVREGGESLPYALWAPPGAYVLQADDIQARIMDAVVYNVHASLGRFHEMRPPDMVEYVVRTVLSVILCGSNDTPPCGLLPFGNRDWDLKLPDGQSWPRNQDMVDAFGRGIVRMDRVQLEEALVAARARNL